MGRRCLGHRRTRRGVKIREEHAPGESEDVNLSAVAVSQGITVVTADERLQKALERTYPSLYLTKEDFISKLEDG